MVKNRLRQLREEKGISQTDIAGRAEVSRQTIHSIETGRYNPSVELALRLAKVLETSVERIFYFVPSTGKKVL